MYKLLIAEDDAAILEKLQYHMDWESVGFQVCGAVTSGLDAMQGIPLLKPDVLLTDMEMPGATGLELIEKIKEENYPVKIVILSAYDSYQYVRSSLRMGAYDYLLKPINEDKLRELFLSLAQAIAEEKQSWNNTSRDSRYLQMSQQAAFSHIFLNYLLGNHTDSQMLQLMMDNYGIRKSSVISVASLRCGNAGEPEKISQLLRNADRNLPFRPFFVSYQKQTVFIFPSEGGCIHNFLKEITGENTDYQCVFSENIPFLQLSATFQKMHINRCVWFYLPENSVLSDSYFADAAQEAEFRMPKADALYDLIKRNQMQPLAEILNAFFSSCDQAKVNPDILTIQVADVYSGVVGMLRMVQPKISADDFEVFYMKLHKQLSLSRFRECVISAFCDLAESFSALCATKGDLIDRVQEYIQQHYAEDISLTSLSESFYVTPAYLSSLFSKRTDQTITTYLQNIRLEKAAVLLLENSLTVAQVGTAVGYPSYPHFCRLFKRRFHVTPTDYRDLHRR